MPPPYDRTIALACTLQTIRARWLHTRCACGCSAAHPVLLMLRRRPELARQTVADAVVRLRCTKCGSRALTVHLCETPLGINAGGLNPHQRPGWTLLLHDGVVGPALAVAAELTL